MVVGLIDKYGVVPKSIYDRSHSFSNLDIINHLLNFELHAHALKLRQIYDKAKANAVDDRGQDSESAVSIGVKGARQAKEAMVSIQFWFKYPSCTAIV